MKIITESTIKFTSPLDFNDPFDCLPHYDTTSISQITHTRPDLYKAIGDRQGLSPAKRLQEKGKFVMQLRKRIEDGSFARDLLGDLGVVCLSRNALNILMWSHYADFHRGLVLEFRIPIMGIHKDLLLATDRLLPLPVCYTVNRPYIKLGIEDHPDDLFNKVALTKSIDWKYEKEERVIDHQRGPGIYKYRRDEILCSVIAGLKMREDNYTYLESVVDHISRESVPNLSLFKAQEKGEYYKLFVEGHPRLESVEKVTNDTVH